MSGGRELGAGSAGCAWLVKWADAGSVIPPVYTAVGRPSKDLVSVRFRNRCDRPLTLHWVSGVPVPAGSQVALSSGRPPTRLVSTLVLSFQYCVGPTVAGGPLVAIDQ